jgi:hypothetical protein
VGSRLFTNCGFCSSKRCPGNRPFSLTTTPYLLGDAIPTSLAPFGILPSAEGFRGSARSGRRQLGDFEIPTLSACHSFTFIGFFVRRWPLPRVFFPSSFRFYRCCCGECIDVSDSKWLRRPPAREISSCPSLDRDHSTRGRA